MKNNFWNGLGGWFKKTAQNIGRWFKSLFVPMDNKEPKLRTLMNSPKTLSFVSSIICIIGGLLVGYLIIILIDAENATSIFGSILKGGFANPYGAGYGLGNQLAYTAPLIMVGLSVLFAYKTGMFNIGVAGQYTLGAFGALYCAIVLNAPWYVCILAAMILGAVWGAIPGLFKALFQVNEVITCIMFNWIGLYMVNDLMSSKITFTRVINDNLTISSMFNRGGANTWSLSTVNKSSLLPDLGLGELFSGTSMSPSKVSIAIIIAIVIAIVIQILLNKTTFGYELRACGKNKNASKYAGINDKSNIILSMTIAGALAGIGAALLFLTDIQQFPKSTTSLSSLAFNGIPVAFMASLNPIGSIFAAFFVAHISEGAGLLTGTTFSKEMANVFTGIIIYFCAFAPLVIEQLSKRKNRLEMQMLEEADAKAKEEKDGKEVNL